MGEYDYSRAGAYFVTIVTQDRECLFGKVVEETMHLNDAGGMAQDIWLGLLRRFPKIDIGPFVIMPNHIHGIIATHGNVGAPLVGAQRLADGQSRENDASRENRATTRVAPTLGNVIGAYKSLTTVEYVRGVREKGWEAFRGRVWQRNYYEHVIRDDDSLSRIEQYILGNPANWLLDLENPSNRTMA